VIFDEVSARRPPDRLERQSCEICVSDHEHGSDVPDRVVQRLPQHVRQPVGNGITLDAVPDAITARRRPRAQRHQVLADDAHDLVEGPEVEHQKTLPDAARSEDPGVQTFVRHGRIDIDRAIGGTRHRVSDSNAREQHESGRVG
jgi:hypothetical protein